MHAMPVVLSAFAAGVALLQTRADLPIAPWAWIAAALALGAIALMWRSRREAIVAGALAAALAGFGYAAWRAEVRLADALPPAWEGVDLAIVGIVDDLPDRSPQGVRFAFAVERVETAGAIVPRRVSLAWSAERDADGDAADAPEVHAGERWRLTVRLKRPHGYAMLGTMLAEEAHTPELLELFREHVVSPRRERLRAALARLPLRVDPAAATRMLVGSLYAARLAGDRLPRRWPEDELDALLGEPG